MRTILVLIGLIFNTLIAAAQNIEQSRLLAAGYQPQHIEQALTTITATNMIDRTNSVEYKAGQSVVLQPGFEARAGSVFIAHTGSVSEGEATVLRVTAYPNPFEEVTTIAYTLIRAGRTNLLIRDTEGKLVAQLLEDQYQQEGPYQIEWKGGHLPTGTYLYTLEIGPQ